LVRKCCSVCGGIDFVFNTVLWKGLIDEWQLSHDEVAYIDRQQGERCSNCGANIRSIALADALLYAFGSEKTLSTFCGSADSTDLRVLELNEAGTLHSELCKLPGHQFGAYPEIDMHAMPFEDGSFDVVVHSDTLEHIPNPIHALQECRRILSPRGALCFTVPIIVGRLSRQREGLPKSYHGNPAESGDDYVVYTEYGADAWTYVIRAGFSSVHLFSFEYPSGIAMAASK
jgi:SAM-dependent methyltransferase